VDGDGQCLDRGKGVNWPRGVAVVGAGGLGACATNQLRRLENESNFLSNAPQFPKEHCFLEGSQGFPVCPSGKRNM
jgi:hypothetical protein